jgi:hypothetical protein
MEGVKKAPGTREEPGRCTFTGSDRLRQGRYETRVQARGGLVVQTGPG